MVKGEKWGNRRKFLATVTGALGLWALKDVGIDEALSAQKRLPNILFIAADDLGYAELGVKAARTFRPRTLTPSLKMASASPTAMSRVQFVLRQGLDG
jgi:hypothetical protein